MMFKKLLTVVAFLVILIFAFAAMKNAPVLSDQKYAYLGELTWYKSFDEGLEIAEREDKPVLIYFWAVWCQFCEKLETITYTDEQVKASLERDFILIAIDLDENSEISNSFGVSYPPAEVFLDSSGREITRVPGYIDPEGFLSTMNEVLRKVN